MEKYMDYTINVCLSRDNYLKKPLKDDIIKMRWDYKQLSIKEFAALIANGYCFCALMQDNWRNKDNFICASMLVYDIDHSTTCMGEYVDKLPIKPTICYTSASNTTGNYAFRLIYCLDFKICSLNEYYTISRSFAEQMNMKDVDEHSFLGEQYWNGSYGCIYYIFNNILYKNNILLNTDYIRDLLGNSSKSITKTITIITHHNNSTDTFEIDQTVKEDFIKLSFQEFIKKYINIYPNIEKTPVELNEDEPVIYYPENYYEIRRPWKRINGEVLKIKDGEGRRRKLYLNGIIRRKINPDISIENMLYNIVYELENYYINNGNAINKKEILEIVNNIMKAEIKDSELGKPIHKFFVNPVYIEKYNLSKTEVLGKLRNKKQYIGEFYDLSLTDKQNIEVMKQYGLDISLITLKRWKKENNIKIYKKGNT